VYVKKAQSFHFRQSIDESSETNAVIQVDFAEKFKFLAQYVIQSSYYNQHAIFIFIFNVMWAEERKISIVLVSDDTSQS
jgi:hypothetical protein